MQLEKFPDYVNNLKNCVQVTAVTLVPGEVTQTTEVYQFDYEGALMAKLDEVKLLPGFISCKKKLIPAKEKKGEIIEDEYWSLTVVIKHA